MTEETSPVKEFIMALGGASEEGTLMVEKRRNTIPATAAAGTRNLMDFTKSIIPAQNGALFFEIL